MKPRLRSSLFLRLFSAFLVAVLLTVLVMSFTMVTLLRAERQTALEAEVRVQARDLAALMQVHETMGIWMLDQTGATSAAVNRKIEELQQLYDAEIWLVNVGGYALIMNGGQVKSEDLRDGNVIGQIRRVLSGEEIRVRGIVTGYDQVITIGVPWFDVAGSQPLGAVLVNVGLDQLRVDYSDLIRNAVLAGVLALALGAGLSFAIARHQTRPIAQINRAVSAYTHGDFEARVEGVTGSDEAAQLASSFNTMAEELGRLDRSRVSFVANVSHELRSPMTSIQGYVQGMLDGTIQPEESKKYLEVVLSETRRLTRLVNDLLDLSRMDAGSLTLNIKTFDITELILSVMFTFEKRIEDKGLDVDISFVEQPCAVKADSALITEVLTNLIDNAVKYSAQGGQLTVWTHDVGGACHVTVKNDGQTIPAEDLPLIFDRFYKVDKAHTVGGGTGLGLAIAKKIMDQHGQTISVTSAGGVTSFTFTLEKA